MGLLAGLLPLSAAAPAPVAAAGPTLPPGFVDEAIRTGLNHPTVVAFAPDGRVFVAEKQGIVRTWSSFAGFAGATAPTQTIDIRTDVDDYWDRGLLGMAVDPGYPAAPYLYLLYSADLTGLGGTTPRWSDTCPRPAPGPASTSEDGCVIYGRLDRYTVDSATGIADATSRHPVIEDWCQQYASHSIGTVAFAPDGMLYVSAGDGANFNGADYGQLGGRLPDTTNPVTPANPCDDPPGATGAPLTAPTAEGGSLRAQSARRAIGQPVSLDGSIIRIDPSTGAAAPGNPLGGSADPNRQRIVAYGFRNPFRFVVQPGTRDLWVGDVGSATWEEVDHVPDPSAATAAPNFGWPCYEGPSSGTVYGATALDLCTSLSQGDTTTPAWTYRHGAKTVPGDACPPISPATSATASVSALAFYGGSDYPTAFRDGLFVADYSRNCLSFIPAGANGQPDTAAVQAFGAAMFTPVNLTVAPGNGDLLYVNFDGRKDALGNPIPSSGEVRRIRYQAPTAVFTATPDQGTAPLDVTLDPAGSSGGGGTSVASYAWDFDGDDRFDLTTASGASFVHQFPQGTSHVRLRVTDQNGATADAVHTVTGGNTAPKVTIAQPLAGLTWAVGDPIPFAASATDAQDPTFPASAFQWTFSMVHCIAPVDPNDPAPDLSTCHTHDVEEIPSAGNPIPVTQGAWIAPDHEYPSYLQIAVTVTDSGGLTDSARVVLTNPQTSTVSVASDPAGAALSIDGATTAGPVTVLRGHQVTVAAPETFTPGAVPVFFSDWSDHGASSHTLAVTAPAIALTARYLPDQADTCAAVGLTTPGRDWLGQLATPGDVDWFRFTVPKTRYHRIVLAGLPVDARLDLYRGCSTLVASSNASGRHWEEIYRSLSAGTYALKVSAVTPGAADLGLYRLRVSPLAESSIVLDYRTRIDSSGRLRIVGEVLDNTAYRVGPVKVTARLYDVAGHLLATRSAYADRPVVAPRTRVPFRIVGSRPAGFHHVTFSVSAPRTSSWPVSPTVGALVRATLGSDWRVTGTLRNPYSYTVRSARALVTLYDIDGVILDTAVATPTDSTLSRRETRPFAVTFAEPGLPPAGTVVRGSAKP